MSTDNDPSSQSRPSEVVALHASLDLTVNFEAKKISGSVTYRVKVQQDGASSFIMDSKHLVISKVTVDGLRTKYVNRPPHEVFGSALEVYLPKEHCHKGNTFKVTVVYHTTLNSTAVQWLPPEQTAGKQRPYLFTQCQAIHARTLLPCQDTPAAKITYDAKVKVPSWATCLMSALSYGEPMTPAKEPNFRVYSFEQRVAIAPYLIAIAVGQLESREISPRSRVWSEPSMVDRAAFDFSQTEDFLKAAEELTCEYKWGRYDILLLPPSFPYGGMENPCLTFVTPTLLTGDKSLASVVAHEISHSWTGNLITNRDWTHFWLNEGWTMFLERKIMVSVLKDKDYFDFDGLLGYQDLREAVKVFESSGQGQLTALVPPLEGIDPDDAFSSVPYEKGFALLYELESRVGSPEFMEFAKAYIEHYKYGTITSEEFKAFFLEHFRGNADKLADFDWDTWLYKPGMPLNAPGFSDSMAQASWQLGDAWVACTRDQPEPRDTKAGEWPKWTVKQQVAMLSRLLESTEEGGKTLALPVIKAMDGAYNLTQSPNSEIRFVWQRLCLRSKAWFIVPHVLEFITSQGRMKFVRPLYRELNAHPETSQQAKEIFRQNASFYHPVCRKMVASDLGVVAEPERPRILSGPRTALLSSPREKHEEDSGGERPHLARIMTALVVIAAVGALLRGRRFWGASLRRNGM